MCTFPLNTEKANLFSGEEWCKTMEIEKASMGMDKEIDQMLTLLT